MAKEVGKVLLEGKGEGSKQIETKPITLKEKSTPLTFRENVIKKIPLVMSFDKTNKAPRRKRTGYQSGLKTNLDLGDT